MKNANEVTCMYRENLKSGKTADKVMKTGIKTGLYLFRNLSGSVCKSSRRNSAEILLK